MHAIHWSSHRALGEPKLFGRIPTRTHIELSEHFDKCELNFEQRKTHANAVSGPEAKRQIGQLIDFVFE